MIRKSFYVALSKFKQLEIINGIKQIVLRTPTNSVMIDSPPPAPTTNDIKEQIDEQLSPLFKTLVVEDTKEHVEDQIGEQFSSRPPSSPLPTPTNKNKKLGEFQTFYSFKELQAFLAKENLCDDDLLIKGVQLHERSHQSTYTAPDSTIEGRIYTSANTSSPVKVVIAWQQTEETFCCEIIDNEILESMRQTR